ncbi:MAG: chromosome segregation ATPase [Urechidicola sp.]|jgi:chromosome segregation ATPase
MDNKDVDAIKSQLKKNRSQSYFFLTLLIVSVLLTAYAFRELQETKKEREKVIIELGNAKKHIQDSKSQLEAKNKKLKKLIDISNESKERLEGYTQRDSLLKEVNELITSSNAPIEINSDLPNLSKEALEKEIDEIKVTINEYDKERKGIVNQLFNKNSETKRKNARNIILKEYSQDDKLVNDILEELKGKINAEFSNSYYQIIYILGELDNEFLQAESEGLKNVFEEGKEKNLHGAMTQKNIKKIEIKME